MTSGARRRLSTAAALAVAAPILAVAVLAASGGGDGALRDASSGAGAQVMPPATAADLLPEPPDPAFTISEPRPLERSRSESTWAAVRRGTLARAGPDRSAVAIGRLERLTPEQTTNVVLVLDRERDSGGTLWIRVRVPALPPTAVGWVPRSALGGYGVVHTRLVIDLSERLLTLLRDGVTLLEVPVGVGRPEYPTPTGEFYIRNKLTRYRSPFYGPVAFGTSARSPTLTDWPAGGFIGIHGTDRPELIPGEVSHGCIRVRNRDIVRLARLMPVGTPLTVKA